MTLVLWYDIITAIISSTLSSLGIYVMRNDTIMDIPVISIIIVVLTTIVTFVAILSTVAVAVEMSDILSGVTHYITKERYMYTTFDADHSNAPYREIFIYDKNGNIFMKFTGPSVVDVYDELIKIQYGDEFEKCEFIYLESIQQVGNDYFVISKG